MLASDYELPSEYLRADPPLTPEVSAWLSGKVARRRAFVSHCESATSNFDRERYCDGWAYNLAAVTITGHSLDGTRTQRAPPPVADDEQEHTFRVIATNTMTNAIDSQVSCGYLSVRFEQRDKGVGSHA
jgi:hypothetical protein